MSVTTEDIFKMSNFKLHLTLEEAETEFSCLMAKIDPAEYNSFLTFIKKHWILPDLARGFNTIGLEKFKLSTEDFDSKEYILDDPVAILNSIAQDIKERIPFDATLPSENIISPKSGENSDCDPKITLHVDEFLYTDDDVDELVEAGKLNRYFCQSCGSKNVKPFIYISHSMSKDGLYHIFNNMLPALEGKTVLDVGSRLGAVLYGAYVYTDARKIIGVEMNEEFCKLQSDIIRKYEMDKRVEIMHNRIEDTEDVVRTSDVVILNNVFEFYLSEAAQIKIWNFLRSNIKKGALIVTQPRIETTFSQLDTGIQVDSWVRPIQSNASTSEDFQFFASDKNDVNSTFTEIACYEVL
ncbi:uncharacterized protein LOC107225726 isoform X1 [Neodiprion lecontei]|uniref:Uncharacterized protein LOC107225726 isoform X1 n=2 Tax=Neodiprion TaxID=270857 RepID=A0A6J0C5X8_NEOLC|nr:uncharacterized protein LOC107225726 isoform X1 [Neodiprion lecontei]XP_046431160.1 uncharacterized protein LOC124184945 isoform X1 [Neodiprion fabricii]